MKRALCLVALLLAAGGCGLGGWMTGPNRVLKLLGSEKVTDFATFEGAVTATCRDVYALIEGVDGQGGAPGTVVGCVLGVTPSGGSERAVFFPLGPLRDQARAVPRLARAAINGRPLGAVAYLADGMSWRAE